MKIAIQACDLDATRIDGTRVYILNLLKYFGKLDDSSEFLIYHKKNFNPELTPPNFPNYKIKTIDFPKFWTQFRFAKEIWRDNADVLWMPVHSLPFFRKKKMKTVVTIHDLAFKYFPEYFTRCDLFKLNLLTDYAIKNSDKIIAVSESTKKDILHFFPKISPEKIRVIYHGFEAETFQKEISNQELNDFLKNYNLTPKNYLLYVGAIQPRKNLEVLLEAFEKIKSSQSSDLKLVIAGEKAWLWKGIMEKIEKSPFRADIILPGKAKFCDVARFMKGARAFVFPSLYEGFGIPLLEAMAIGTPVIASDNSSLPEVGGSAVLYFDPRNSDELKEKISLILDNQNFEKDLVVKGLEQVKKFSWEKCAQETLEYLKS